jgi:hypothetical protein
MQCDMMMPVALNTWSDVEITRTLYNTANDNYATAVTIGRIAMDITGKSQASATTGPPPTNVNTRIGSAAVVPETKSLLNYGKK